MKLLQESKELTRVKYIELVWQLLCFNLLISQARNLKPKKVKTILSRITQLFNGRVRTESQEPSIAV